MKCRHCGATLTPFLPGLFTDGRMSMKCEDGGTDAEYHEPEEATP